MNSSKIHDNEQTKRDINGMRPSSLKINKDSHFIHKSSSSISSNSSANQLRQPVIIYTHSPKIIHTQARDFMALVQKLTGMSPSDVETEPPQPQLKSSDHDNDESSSVLTDDNNCAVGGSGIHVGSSSSLSPILNQPNQYFGDIPLFTPNSNSTEFFCSPQRVYRYPDSNMGNSISPSFMEFMKGLPEY